MADRISVVICSYNYGRFLGRCLESVFAQVRLPDEVIVVDDGSVDETAQVVQRFSGVTYLRQPNRGKAVAFSHGFNATSGEVLCHLDADDFWAPGKLDRIASIIAANPQVGGLLHDATSVDTDGIPIANPLVSSSAPVNCTFMELLLSWFGELPIRHRMVRGCANTICVRRSAVAEFMPLPAELGLAVDGFLVLAAGLSGLVYVAEELSMYRNHGSNYFGPKTMAGQMFLYPWLLSHPVFLCKTSLEERELLLAKYLEEQLRQSLVLGRPLFPNSRLVAEAYLRLMVSQLVTTRFKRWARTCGGPVTTAYMAVKRRWVLTHHRGGR